MMKKILIMISFFVLTFWLAICSAQSVNIPAQSELKAEIRSDHPRLFFNSGIFPAVKSRALNEEKELFDLMKSRAESIDPDTLSAGDFGINASENAFVYLVNGEKRFLNNTKTLLKKSVSFYQDCYKKKTPVSWYGFSQINAWAAFDWIYNELTPDERTLIAKSFLEEVENIQPTDKREPFLPQENWSGTDTGFYGNRSILWFAGLATFKEGFDDTRAEYFLTEGFRSFIEVLNNRMSCAGDDGGAASATLAYSIDAYPWAEFNFFHTFMSATGKDISHEWPYVSYLPGYIYWNMLPGGFEFGVGDAHHTSNRIPLETMSMHIEQIIHFYGKTNPAGAVFASRLKKYTPSRPYTFFPFTPFLLTNLKSLNESSAKEKAMPHARNFENMGQIFMRSGDGPDDTYALFMSGGNAGQHKHYDNNNFLIFKKGFLTLDTGSRPIGIHTQHYYPRTIAHNCILINMPGEELPVYYDKGVRSARRWGPPAPGEIDVPVPNDGGQNELLGSKVTAFETCDNYSYMAGDATKAYNSEKSSLVLRQFVFLNPDFFVVFDRVISKKPEYKKTWIMHTATEPVIDGDVFSASQNEGKIFVKTLLPENQQIIKIGGPGKQFWNGDRNFPFPQGYYADSLETFGQWRVEISPSEDYAETNFLHFIDVGGLDKVGISDSRLIKENGMVGLVINKEKKEWKILFGTKNGASGKIIIKYKGKTIINRNFTKSVMTQRGLFGSE